jgi:hypothetical protein
MNGVRKDTGCSVVTAGSARGTPRPFFTLNVSENQRGKHQQGLCWEYQNDPADCGQRRSLFFAEQVSALPTAADLVACTPVKLATTQVKVLSIELNCSRSKTAPTASPRGGVGSRRRIEQAGRNEDEPHPMSLEKSNNHRSSRAATFTAKTDGKGTGWCMVALVQQLDVPFNAVAGSARAACLEVLPG